VGNQVQQLLQFGFEFEGVRHGCLRRIGRTMNADQPRSGIKKKEF
jgi:hypothetical protein